jgi:hypothetical protein
VPSPPESIPFRQTQYSILPIFHHPTAYAPRQNQVFLTRPKGPGFQECNEGPSASKAGLKPGTAYETGQKLKGFRYQVSAQPLDAGAAGLIEEETRKK